MKTQYTAIELFKIGIIIKMLLGAFTQAERISQYLHHLILKMKFYNRFNSNNNTYNNQKQIQKDIIEMQFQNQ